MILAHWWPLVLAPMGGLVTLLLSPFLRRYLLDKGVIDLPGVRRSHQVPTPRGGGLAMAAGLLPVLVALALLETAMAILVLLVLVLVLVGWLDDRHDLGIRWRMLAQLLVAALLVGSVGGVDRVEMGGHVFRAPWLWTPLALVGVIWLINLHNFMDGSDGLAGSQGVWAGVAFAVVFATLDLLVPAVASLALVAVCLGFLVWNWPPAKLFMGDTGSLLIGGMVAWMVMTALATGSVSPWTGLIIASVFVVDATLTLLRRVARGERWYTPHRQHAYQRLIACGWSHGQVLGLYAGANLVLVMPATLLAVRHPQLDIWLAALLVGLLVLFWLLIQFATNGERSTA